MKAFRLLVEGLIDEAVGRRIIEAQGGEVIAVHGKRGWTSVQREVARFAVSATTPVLALVDFCDTKLPCPPEVVRRWLPHTNGRVLLRVVVPEIESWLLADRLALADYLSIPAAKLPGSPEVVSDPKAFLVGVARNARSQEMRRSMVPAAGTSAIVGPGYNGTMIRFVTQHWSPQRARANSASLDRCLLAVERLSTR